MSASRRRNAAPRVPTSASTFASGNELIGRRISSILAASFLASSLLGIELEIGKRTGAPGEIAEIPIAITLAGAPIVAVEADISLPAPLTYTFAPLVRGELQDVRGSVETIPGGLRLRFVARPGQTIGDGEVGVIALSVAADTDERPLHLVVTGARAFGSDGRAISLTTANGVVDVVSLATATTRRRAVRPPADAPQPVLPTTAQKIDQAVRGGKINSETALLYKVYDGFADPRLPPEYKGDDSAVAENSVIYEALDRFSSLSLPTQNALTPFLLPPFHEGSWLSPSRSGKGTVRSQALSSFCGPVDFVNWDYLDNSDATVRVWWQKKFAQTDQPKAAEIVQQLNAKILSALKKLMSRSPPKDSPGTCRGITDALDIALIDGRSVTIPYSHCLILAQLSNYILLDRNKPSDKLIPTAAHELMHSIQLTFLPDNCESIIEYRWIMEATAQWVMDYVYPSGAYGDAEREFGHPKFFLYEPYLPLDYLPAPQDDGHAYSAYLFPFFMAMAIKDKPADTDFARRVFSNARSGPSLEAVDRAAGGFDTIWPQFALYNWNRDPVNDYEKNDHITLGANSLDFPSWPPANQEVNKEIKLGGQQSTTEAFKISLDHLSAEYHHFTFPDDNARGVTFYNGLTFRLTRKASVAFSDALVYASEAVPADAKKGASIQALFKINGQWKEKEDWTDLPYVAFCRDAKDERIEELVIIFSNKSNEKGYVLKHQGDIPPKLFINNIGCWGWKGKVTFHSDDGKTIYDVSGDLTWKRVKWPKRDQSTPLENLPYTTFEAQGRMSGSYADSKCGFQKPLDYAVLPDGPPLSMNYLTVYNFTVGGSRDRASMGHGFNLPLAPVGTYPCPDDETHGYIYPPWLFIPEPEAALPTLGHIIQVPADGTLKGQFRVDEAPATALFTWDLKPIRE